MKTIQCFRRTTLIAGMLLFAFTGWGQSVFFTNFNETDGWNNPGGSWTAYNLKTYEEGGWFFNAENSIRDTDNTYAGSNYAFRNRADFTIYNTASISEISGFKIIMRDWRLIPKASRNILLSTDGGDNWNIIGTIDAEFFPDGDNYYPFEFNFPGGAQNFNANDLQIKMEGEANNNNRLRIGGYEVLGSGSGNIPPSISDITQNPAADITSTITVSVSALITQGDAPISFVKLRWGTVSGNYPNEIYMSVSVKGGTYTTDEDIPAQPDGTLVYYIIYTEDENDESATSPQRSYSVRDPRFTTLPYNEPFDNNLGNCYTYSVSGPTKFWMHATTADNGYAMMNGWNSLELEEDWLILPGINMDDYDNVILNFETAWNFGVEDEDNYLKLFYSTDYAGIGDPTTAGWTELAFTKPAEGGYVWQSSGNIELSGIQGVVWLGFKYHYSEDYRRWQVDDIHIFESGSPLLSVEPTTLSGFTYQVGSGPSLEQTFNVGGTNLLDDISIAPPANYEISTASGANFVATDPVVLTHEDGTVETTAIFVRLKAGLGIGDYNETIAVSSADVSPVLVSCSGSVTPEVTPPLVIDSPNYVYMQDFNSLASSGTGNPWTDNETLVGWYWQCQNPDRDPNNVGYWTHDGSNNNVQATSFGATGSNDRAMGSISGASNRNFFHGVQFWNNTGTTINFAEIFITFTGEQWRQTSLQHILAFSYKKSPTIITDLLDGIWTPNTSLDFTALHIGPDGALNGNDAANRTGFANVPLAGEGTLAPGQYIMLRWAKTGPSAPGLAIDDFILSLSEVTIIENPLNFIAASANTSEIDLSWQPNSNSDPVLIAWSADGVFGSQPDTQTPGEDIAGGGIVLYYGTATEATHEELEAGTTYYYKAWSYYNGSYSSGTVAQATTVPLPATTALPYTETFDDDLGDCYVYSVSGPTKYWIHNTVAENGFASMNGFNSGDIEEDWLILPGINFNNYENEMITFDTWYRFGEDDDNNYLKLFYAADYSGTGDPTGSSWIELPFARPDGEQVWASSGNVDLSGITGEMVYIGFKYHYEPGTYRWWQVDNISITGDPVGIGKKPVYTLLNISPNPTSGLVNIDIPENAYRIAVYDMTGSLIEESGVVQPKHVLNLGSHKKGIYLIELIFTDGKLPARSKVIVQ